VNNVPSATLAILAIFAVGALTPSTAITWAGAASGAPTLAAHGTDVAGNSALFEQLKQMLSDEPDRPQAKIARELSMSENAVKQAFHRLRQRYRLLLREEIAQTVAVPGDVEEELRHFIAILQT